MVFRFQDCLKAMSTPLWWLSVRKVHKEKDLCSTAARSCTNGSHSRLVWELVVSFRLSLELSIIEVLKFFLKAVLCCPKIVSSGSTFCITFTFSSHRSWTTCTLFSLWIRHQKVWRAELLLLQPCSTGRLSKLETSLQGYKVVQCFIDPLWNYSRS